MTMNSMTNAEINQLSYVAMDSGTASSATNSSPSGA